MVSAGGGKCLDLCVWQAMKTVDFILNVIGSLRKVICRKLDTIIFQNQNYLRCFNDCFSFHGYVKATSYLTLLKCYSLLWWHMPAILACGKLRQKDQEFMVSLSYKASSSAGELCETLK